MSKPIVFDNDVAERTRRNKLLFPKIKKQCKRCRGTGKRFGRRDIPTVCGECMGRGYNWPIKFAKVGNWFNEGVW